jgi:hypothetical protein
MNDIEAEIASPAPIPSAAIRRQMMADHAEIEAVFGEVADAFKCGDWDVASAAFSRLEQRLVSHLALEDELLLPALEKLDPAEAAAIAEDHARIRARLHELGIGLELHYTRATAFAELVEMLRAHARREDALLYRWADQMLGALDRNAVTGRLP